MKPFVGWTRVAVMGVLSLQLCVAAFAQEEKSEQDLGANTQSSPTGQTGAGTGNTGIAAAKPGQADGTGNPRLGGRRPLYRLNQSDVVALSFTLSPEFDQTLTIQPDGYVTLKDAGPVLAQGLTVEEFRLAVGRAYTGYLHHPQVAVALKIDLNTVQRAYAELERDGVLSKQRGVGTFEVARQKVREKKDKTSPVPGLH